MLPLSSKTKATENVRSVNFRSVLERVRYVAPLYHAHIALSVKILSIILVELLHDDSAKGLKYVRILRDLKSSHDIRTE